MNRYDYRIEIKWIILVTFGNVEKFMYRDFWWQQLFLINCLESQRIIYPVPTPLYPYFIEVRELRGSNSEQKDPVAFSYFVCPSTHGRSKSHSDPSNRQFSVRKFRQAPFILMISWWVVSFQFSNTQKVFK